MPVFPRGHDSVATDYCDECGAPIGGRSAGSPPPSAVTPSASSSPSMPAAQSGGSCPDCGSPRTGRFCETCGHDFLAVPAPEPAPGAVPATVPAAPELVAAASPGGAGMPDATGGAPDAAAAAAADAGLPRRANPAGWRIVVTADREYHERMRAANPDAEPIPFPAFCPERRFALPNRQAVIGRRSRSRGIEPEIDLTGPPEDPAISHAHALLITVPEGWAVVDLNSANGTYVNDSPDPIEANMPVPVGAGDRIHVGAFTTMTLHVHS